MSDAHSHVPGHTAGEIRTGYIAVLVIIFCVLLFATFVLLRSLFVQVNEEQMYIKNASVANPALSELRVREAEALTKYRALDKANGVYQIPVSRAMELVAQELAGKSAAVSAPAPATSPVSDGTAPEAGVVPVEGANAPATGEAAPVPAVPAAGDGAQ